jgi:hypothetical protein
MEKANIQVTTTNTRGGQPKDTVVGRVSVYFDGTLDNRISVDAFQGYGNSYEKRKECEIEIELDGKVWGGSKEELRTILFGEE